MQNRAPSETERNLQITERAVISFILSIIFLATIIDVVSDLHEGAEFGHLLLEGVLALSSLGGILFIFFRSRAYKRQWVQERARSQALQAEAERWKKDSSRLLAGLGEAIDKQLNLWKLSPAEKDVALFLLKGFGIKEIAQLRGRAEKTIRQQSLAVYAKSGLAGRAELAAFFLEDLSIPQTAQPHQEP